MEEEEERRVLSATVDQTTKHGNHPPPGELIKMHLNFSNMTQKQLADALDLSRSNITNIINNRRKITPRLALKLARIFPETSAEIWVRMQAYYDLSLAKQEEDREKRKE